ncbi:hypothetical protein OHA27_25630 [Streptomyces sp. NBC_01619]|uniref:hypothetical protein n=1 Tax=Streptomyces sp. NBC_01619 TaxID=2975901 RepID=UPI0022581F4F|nr:hypothetical protein [Streptomyces sp. NBC_01619]MCX4513644.1 hypothetical protein [Streptomyces sp. NBC_01619]
MSEEKQPKSDTKPPLTTQEQEQAKEQEQIEGQFAATDMVEQMQDFFDVFGFGSTGSVLGSTVFDGRKLNEMLDFLESTNPADLEHAGVALENANVAINKAAKELEDFVKKTDWEGEGAKEFQRYGKEVVSYAWSVGKMANAVGAQMKVASTGLTSVRNARPPRDNRVIQKDVKDFKLPEQTADNPEYQRALQVEKDRQEAINQMNRLASFYVVSQSTLAAQEAPKPPAAYKAAVPFPSRERSPGESAEASGSRGDSSRSIPGQAGSVDASGVTEGGPRTEALGKPGSGTGSTSMEIDSVATAPPPTTTGPTATPPPTVNNPNQATNPINLPPTSLGLPGRAGPAPRTGDSRTAGGPPSKAVGRAGTTGGSQPPMGRSATSTGRSPAAPNGTSSGRSPMVGRPSATGMPGGGTTGRPGTGGSSSQAPIVGRPGGTSQPAAGRSTGTSGPSGSRGNGIIGGTPQRATGGSTGSRIPRGTIIGGDSPASGRSSAARPSQAGVVGANSASQAARPVGRGTASVNGVVGTPRAGGTRPGAGTTGGTGGRAGQRRQGSDEQERGGAARPDYLTEDEETWANRRRGAVPPVID